MWLGPYASNVDQHVENDIGPEIARQLLADASVALGRNGADIDADDGPIRHRVDVEATLHCADVKRRCA